LGLRAEGASPPTNPPKKGVQKEAEQKNKTVTRARFPPVGSGALSAVLLFCCLLFSQFGKPHRTPVGRAMWFSQTLPQGGFFFDVVSKPLGAFQLHFLIVRCRERKSTMSGLLVFSALLVGKNRPKARAGQMGLCPKPR